MPDADLQLVPFAKEHLDGAASLFVDVFAAEPWKESWTVESAGRRLHDLVRSPGFLGVVAFREGELVGFALGRLEAYQEEEHFCLHEMCVATRWQRQGVGMQIMAHLEAKLKERGCRQVYLLTARDSAAESFYSRCGFSPARRTRVMVKRLPLDSDANKNRGPGA